MNYFIINPASKSGYGAVVWWDIKRLMQKNHIPYRFIITRKAGDATYFMRRLTMSRHPKEIFILGGDGTLHEALNGLQNADVHTVAYIPTGSANDFAKSLGLSTSIKELMKQYVLETHTTAYDLGIAKGLNSLKPRKKPQKPIKFVVSCGLGFDASICHEIHTSRIKKVCNYLHLGKISYALIALKTCLFYRCSGITITADDKEPVTLPRVLFASVHMHPYEGGGFPFAPMANPTDGKMDLCIAYDLTLRKLLPLLPAVMKGEHVGMPGVKHITCQKCIIHADTPMAFHTDGEGLEYYDKLEIKVEKGAYRFKR